MFCFRSYIVVSAIGSADDFDDRDGNLILDLWQAQEKARAIGHRERGSAAERPATVAEATDRYEADLRARQGDAGNVTRLRAHLSERLKGKVVALLTARDLRAWRDGLTKRTHGRKTAEHETAKTSDSLTLLSVNRISTVFKAALNLVAVQDERIANRRAWETGLAARPDAEQPRNVILSEPVIRQIIAEAHKQDMAFGLLVETAAGTGARMSQLKRMEIQDFQDDGGVPRLMVPTSRKGSGIKKLRRPVPIPTGLAVKLRAAAAGRPAVSLADKDRRRGVGQEGPWGKIRERRRSSWTRSQAGDCLRAAALQQRAPAAGECASACCRCESRHKRFND